MINSFISLIYLQTIASLRSENCCLLLISNLLASCQMDVGNESESETSSIEILKALTSHMTSCASPINGNMNQSEVRDPSMAFFDKLTSVQPNNVDNNTKIEETETNNTEYLEKMITNEENYFAFILLKCLKLCPSIFGKEQKYVSKTPSYILNFLFICIRRTDNKSGNCKMGE